MFQSEEQRIKFIKTYLNKLKLQQSISQQQIEVFYTQLKEISEKKRYNLIQRAIQLNLEFKNHIPDEFQQYLSNNEQEHNPRLGDEALKLIQSKRNRFEGLEQGDNYEVKKKIQQSRGSLNNAFALQNTILALLIDGYTGAGKKMFNYLFSNGNRGLLLNNLHVHNVSGRLGEYLNQNTIQELLRKQSQARVSTNQVHCDQISQLQEAVPTVLVPECQKVANEADTEQVKIDPNSYKKDELLPTFGSQALFKQLFIPERPTGLNSELCFCLTPEEFESFDYGYTINQNSIINEIQNQDSQNLPVFEIFSLDCEMVQVGEDRKDLALARVTVIDEQFNVIFDEVCKPEQQIVDYLTKYSGITAQMLQNAQSQQQLMQKFNQLFTDLNIQPPSQSMLSNQNNKTQDLIYKYPVLVGHGLDNDFKYLQITPQFVIDTAVLLRVGKHKKLKLKYLAEVLLDKSIQKESDDVGHNSEEDANAALELVYGAFYAFGSETLKLKYQEYKEIGEKIIKKYGSGSQSILTRLNNAVSKCWYHVDIYWKESLKQYIQEFVLNNNNKQFHMLNNVLAQQETFNNRFFIINEDYANNFKEQSYIEQLSTQLPKGSIVITILNVNNQSQSLAFSFIVQ